MNSYHIIYTLTHQMCDVQGINMKMLIFFFLKCNINLPGKTNLLPKLKCWSENLWVPHMAVCVLQIVFSLIKSPGDLAKEFLPIFTRAHNFSSNCSLQMCYFPTASFPSEGGCLKICIHNVKQHLVLTQTISSSANLVAAAEEIRLV